MVMSFKPDWKQQAVETLVADDLDAMRNGFEDVAISVLRWGFQGYYNMTDEELEQELRERDISTVFGEIDG
jgi:hypothetical protein